MATIFRIGEGHPKDKKSYWFISKDIALKFAKETKKPIFISVNGNKYKEITLEELEQYGDD